MSSGAAEETVAGQTGIVAEVVEDLGEEKISRARNLAFHKIDIQLLNLQAHLIKAEEYQQPMMTTTENVKLSRATWRSGRARNNGSFPLIPLLRIHYLDLQISHQKS